MDHQPTLIEAVVDEAALAPDAVRGGWSWIGLGIRDVTERSLAAAALVLLSPILLAIAIAIRLDSPGPALFKQVRIGLKGRPFTFIKFRGMYIDALARFPELYSYRYTQSEIDNLHFHSETDPRVTRVGRFIRSTSLDELPNFINVVWGDMSLVGPRPEIPEMIPYYGTAAGEILSVKPGVTSMAKVIGRDHLNFMETLALDLEYVRNRGWAKDFRILCSTLVLVVTGRSVGL
ncbi:MAG: sugar transferase [Candidatus Eisenbacteria bacterium]|uniref:Sugar transferase n=1 Tax=Eiseniibacteriota bacterium TaxID=2212470 RepID=A0A538TAF0_UNCEI|nr:MAG: sugar transferase [Candidatus Eisenbacteria bacterium]